LVSGIFSGMSRVKRLRTGERIFFVTVNLRQSLPLLTAREYPLIVECLEESRRRLGFLLCGYVLMPDHWHALIWPRSPLSISRVIQDIKYVSSRRLNRARGSAGTLWQHQFWDRIVRHAKEFGERLAYMHMNPVRKGLANRPDDWRWSSYQNFSLEERARAAGPIQTDYVRLPDSYRG
jgi:REP-associated tyrosine transposase